MSRSLRHFVLGLAAVTAFALAGAARADARQDLHAAYRKMMALTAFKATIVEVPSGKAGVTIEYRAPDRYRIRVPGQGPQLIIGDTMVMDINGQVMRMPLPKGSLPKLRNEDGLRELEKGSLVEAAGTGMVGTQPARIYRQTSQVDGKPVQSQVWVGVASGLPLQVETRGAKGGKDARIVYSDFNSPKIRIEAP